MAIRDLTLAVPLKNCLYSLLFTIDSTTYAPASASSLRHYKFVALIGVLAFDLFNFMLGAIGSIEWVVLVHIINFLS